MKVVFIKTNEIAEPEESMRQTYDLDKLEELQKSIQAVGLINPITLKKVAKGYEIIAGFRRYTACKILSWEQIPAIVYAKEGIEGEKMKIAENLTREEINPIDEGQYLKQIKEKYKITQRELGEMINRSEAYVSDRIAAVEWHPELKRAAKEGLITFSIARELNKLDDEAQLYACLNSAIEFGMSPAAARSAVQQYKAINLNSELSSSITDFSPDETMLLGSKMLQTCQICSVAAEPREMVYLTICPECVSRIKKN